MTVGLSMTALSTHAHFDDLVGYTVIVPAKGNMQCSMISTTKQATSIKLATIVDL